MSIQLRSVDTGSLPPLAFSSKANMKMAPVQHQDLDDSTYRAPATELMESIVKKSTSMLEMNEMKLIHQLSEKEADSSSRSGNTFSCSPSPPSDDSVSQEDFFFYDNDSNSSSGSVLFSVEERKGKTAADLAEERKSNEEKFSNGLSLGSRCASQSALMSSTFDPVFEDEQYEEDECKKDDSIDQELVSQIEEGRRKQNEQLICSNNSHTPPKNESMRRCVSQSILRTPSFHLNPSDDASSTDRPSSSKSSFAKRTTSFSKIEIREYHITLGDNPGGAAGPPISLDWKYKRNPVVLNLDDYEEKRPTRRTRQELYMVEGIRKWRLMREKGISLKEMEKASKQAENVRKSRKKHQKPNTVENLKKSFGRMIKGSS